jgi:hypothetical protein
MTPGPALLTGIEEHQGLARKALQLVEQWALVVARRLDVLVVEVNRQQERTLIGQGDAMPGEEEQGDVAPCSGFSRSGSEGLAPVHLRSISAGVLSFVSVSAISARMMSRGDTFSLS